MVKSLLLLVALLAVWLPGGPLAGGARAAEAGAGLAGACQGCHGAAGAGGQGMPALAGRHGAAELVALLQGFRGNTLPATVMGRIARGYTEAEIAALAAFYARRD